MLKKIKNKIDVMGTYPACDLLNSALFYLLKDEAVIQNNKVVLAVEDIIRAITKANGYIYSNNFDKLVEFGLVCDDDRDDFVLKNKRGL